jgi:hypothetical protein
MSNAWLTPTAAPGVTRDVVLTVPDSEDFEAIIRGALTLLLMASNYEQSPGGLTPEETVEELLPAIMQTFGSWS